MKTSARTSRHGEKQMLLDLLPDQGQWSDEEYLWLTDHTNRLVEFSDGIVEVLPVPTDLHQAILRVMFLAFDAFVTPLGGTVRFAPLRLQLRTGTFREPDLLLLRHATDPRRQNRFWTGADLVLEVVCEDHSERDLVQKRDEYARTKIPEYWIINPLNATILVYRLKGTKYPKANTWTRGTSATSVLLPGFGVEVDKVLDAE